MSGHWFLPHAPCPTVYAVLCVLYCGIASVYDSSGNVRTEFYNMIRSDSYCVLNAVIPYVFLYVANIAKFYVLVL